MHSFVLLAVSQTCNQNSPFSSGRAGHNLCSFFTHKLKHTLCQTTSPLKRISPRSARRKLSNDKEIFPDELKQILARRPEGWQILGTLKNGQLCVLKRPGLTGIHNSDCVSTLAPTHTHTTHTQHTHTHTHTRTHQRTTESVCIPQMTSARVNGSHITVNFYVTNTVTGVIARDR
jgi:hypothetical protein